jgi:hypothetical protein
MAKKSAVQTKLESSTGALPARFVAPEQASALAGMLQLTSEELQQIAGGARAGCCKPDGGSCCTRLQ